MGDEDHRTEAAILWLTRLVQGGFEPQAAANARLRQAVKRFEATAGALESPNAGGRPRHGRRVS